MQVKITYLECEKIRIKDRAKPFLKDTAMEPHTSFLLSLEIQVLSVVNAQLCPHGVKAENYALGKTVFTETR